MLTYENLSWKSADQTWALGLNADTRLLVVGPLSRRRARSAVREAAAVPVPSEMSEAEVLVVPVPATGSSIEPEEVIRHLQAGVVHHMIPRYVRFLDALPKTPTAKVEKHALRAQGVTEDTWDRECAVISIRREQL